jgi:hypothetical protein
MIVPELICGVTPLLIEIPGVNVPEYKIFPVPELAVPTEKNVADAGAPPVEAVNACSAARLTVRAETVNAAEVRATPTRAYEV